MNISLYTLAGMPARAGRQLLLQFKVRIVPPLLARKTERAFAGRRPGKPHGLPAPLIVSLTSHPARFRQLPLTLKCLLAQSVAADRTVLWVALEHKDILPAAVRDLQRHGLQIDYCDNLRSYKKIIPALERYRNSFIVTADDDLYYWPTWLEELVQSYGNNPREVVCHRVHRIRLGANRVPLAYRQWESEYAQGDPSPLNFPTNGAGALYPPNIFFREVRDADTFQRLCPDADDVWLYWMMRLNGGVARKVGPRHFVYCWRHTQHSGLIHGNLVDGGNDAQIAAMLRAYGMPLCG